MLGFAELKKLDLFLFRFRLDFEFKLVLGLESVFFDFLYFLDTDNEFFVGFFLYIFPMIL